MNREFPDRPIVGVGGVVVQDGRALLVRRATEPLKGEWSIPGGVVELGEKLREAVAREVLEETGLAVEAGDVLDVFDSIFTHPDGRTRYHFVLIDFFCKPVSGTLQAASDVSEVRWISAEELTGFPIRDITAGVIRKGLSLEAKHRESNAPPL